MNMKAHELARLLLLFSEDAEINTALEVGIPIHEPNGLRAISGENVFKLRDAGWDPWSTHDAILVIPEGEISEDFIDPALRSGG